MKLSGTIKFVGYYADSIERLEIAIADPKQLPVKAGERVHSSRVGDALYTAGVRSTQDAGVWVSSDLYSTNGSDKKIGVADVLLDNGFENQNVTLPVDTQLKKFLTEAASKTTKKTAGISYVFGIGQGRRAPFADNDDHLERVGELKVVAHAEELIDIYRDYIKQFHTYSRSVGKCLLDV